MLHRSAFAELPVARGTPRSQLLLGLVLMAACATNPVMRRATVISDADQAAKAALANENRLDPGKIPARTFAVTPFTVATRDTILRPLGFGMADLLANDLAKSPELRLVERVQTEAIMRELSLVDEGITDPREAPRVGRLIGARRILIGNASMVPGGDVRLSARVVDAIAGTVQDLVSADAPLDRIIDAEKALALLLFERLGITLTPAQRLSIEQRQSSQLAALVAYGRGVQAEAKGDASAAIAAFEEASRLDAAFSAARAQAQAAPSGASSRSSSAANSVARVVDLAAQGVNAPVAVKLPEAVDAPLAANSRLPILFIIRILP
ncbi:MAG: CsgG/HfaB family protein [Gemmatimonadaceae bacterium]